MIRHLKHIISAFIFLCLLGIGENLPVSAFSVRSMKETAWVTKAGSSEKISKCCTYIRYIFNKDRCLVLKTWPDEFSCYDHQKVKVQIISRVSIQHIITSKRLLLVKLYGTKRSMEDYLIS